MHKPSILYLLATLNVTETGANSFQYEEVKELRLLT